MKLSGGCQSIYKEAWTDNHATLFSLVEKYWAMGKMDLVR